MAKEHAILGASSAHRWLACPPSARLEASIPDRPGPYAQEGRVAHAVAESKLRRRLGGNARALARALETLRADPHYSDEMLEHARTFCGYVAGVARRFPVKPHIAVEKSLDYSQWAPEGFGTADCVIVCGGELHLVEYKYGKGVPVSARDNPQLMLYALGAHAAYGFLHGIHTVRLAVVQPRLNIQSVRELPLGDLMAWGESIKPAARLAWEGAGDYQPGGHCRFCRARGACRARAEHCLELEAYGRKTPPLLTNEEAGRILTSAGELAAWARALEEYALQECLEGREVPGWKAVEGRRVRALTDLSAAADALAAAGLGGEILYKRTPATLGEIEKALTPREFNRILSGCVTMQPGKPTLAPESDRREALAPQA